ncbi:MAG: holo-[acyl-carrier-protein] synthase [Spiroplasma sp. WSS]|uniref:holo-ACP synthase n=1 Tax=unclassified Spiroplasma TaxID=2637901 RepID=UPI00121608CC|nr:MULTISPECIES: holo-ACP synthase [unclassified Spiroplasma]MBP1525230.1 holo-ACP synthase [Spiroplasma ixodetis]TLF24870.1 MAG: holo-[acyl-carrier-protein] synthase [Spiroplasma sp. WSS]WDA54635.1 MAG: holo-ACP synthase [Spiroplasma endosymbiont of Drosophila atripex]MBP1526774.1 holo-ACP synthase [Spiroplasma ixodetis]MBP1527923.1 holo-ACP synthase [Spiroplasma ixodetis]
MRSVGIDIIEVNRIENIEEFAKRILSKKEIILFNQYSLQRQQEFLAGRWALKEAIFKALPQEKLTFKNIDISYNQYNQPITIIKNYQLLLSLSHNETNAIAIAIVI